MKYNVGDKVRIKSIDWYNENKDEHSKINCGKWNFIKTMTAFCGKIMTISNVGYDYYKMLEDYSECRWTNEMIEGLVEEETKNWADISIPEDPYTVTYDSPSINDSMNKNNIHNGIILPKGYIFKDENGNVINATKIVLEKKKKEYPKTYEECCEVLDFCGDYFLTTYDADCMVKKEVYGILQQVNSLTRLLICKSAYWKIVGEEMGLGKPWEPDWNGKLYYLYYNPTNTTGVVRGFTSDGVLAYVVLAFPTEEMRDAFYENFKTEIEQCKELL